MLHTQTSSDMNVQFQQLARIPENINELYRNCDEFTDIFYDLSSVLGGFFCRNYPTIVTINEIKKHVTTNMSGQPHFVGMSQAKDIGWNKDLTITIDPTLFRNFIIDVRTSYAKHCLTFPARMEREQEHITLVIFFCCVKSLNIGTKEIPNPFYIPIEKDNTNAIEKFSALYANYVNFLQSKYNQTLSQQQEKNFIQKFAVDYLNFYAEFSNPNPFNQTYSALSKKAEDCEFVKIFLSKNAHFLRPSAEGLLLFNNQPLLKDVVFKNSHAIFQDNYYYKQISSIIASAHHETLTCEEDPYARPVYD